MDLVYVVGWTLVWDPHKIMWCDKFPAEDERHFEESVMDDHHWCGQNGSAREQYLWEWIIEESTYFGNTEFCVPEHMPQAFASDLHTIDDIEFGVVMWEFAGTFRELTHQMLRADRALSRL